MKIIRAEESHLMQNGKSCTATEYPTSSPNINIARITISGRFPETGVMWNTAVEEIVYVEGGSGKVVIDAIEVILKKGDVVSYQKNERVFWQGEMTLLIACTPAWTPDQHRVER